MMFITPKEKVAACSSPLPPEGEGTVSLLTSSGRKRCVPTLQEEITLCSSPFKGEVRRGMGFRLMDRTAGC